MTSSAGPTNKLSTHHVTLTDGATTVGLIMCDAQGNPQVRSFQRTGYPRPSLKTYSGNLTQSDYEPPWCAEVQTDWSGGMGYADFNKNSAGYADGSCINTMHAGEIIIGPSANYATMSTRDYCMNWPRLCNRGTMFHYFNGYRYLGQKFTTVGGYTATHIELTLMIYAGTPPTLTVSLYSDVGAAPGVLQQSGTVAVTGFSVGEYQTVRVALAAGVVLAATTSYWIVIDQGAASSVGACWGEMYSTTTGVASRILMSNNGTTWTSLGYDFNLYYRVLPADKYMRAFFGEYRGVGLCALTYEDGTVSDVLMNGECGVASGASSSTTLHVHGKTWTADVWKGCIVKIMKGTGKGQWRLITSNISDELTVSPAWDVTPATLVSEYAIVASDIWTEIGTAAYTAGHGWTAGPPPVVATDMIVANGMVFFALGDAVAVSRLRLYNNAGTWTEVWLNEAAGSMGTYLGRAGDQNGDYLWTLTRGGPSTYNYADISTVDGSGGGASPAALTWLATALNIGNTDSFTSNCLNYGEYGNLYVIKEDGIMQIVDKKPYLVPISELPESCDYRNGIAAIQWNVYLVFSWHNTLLRWYQNSLDNIGMTSTENGLPYNRQGNVAAVVGYPGMLIKAIDAGPNGYSSILAWNAQGWCELYRAPVAGRRIRSMWIQPIPGDAVDRLWFTCGSDIMHLPLSEDPFRHPTTSADVYNHYTYSHQGTFITAWYNLGSDAIKKIFEHINVSLDGNFNGAGLETTVYYQVNYESDTWVKLTTDYAGSSIYAEREIDPTNAHAVTGYHIRFKFVMRNAAYSGDPHDTKYTTRITKTGLDLVARVPHKHKVVMTFRAVDNDVCLPRSAQAHDDYTSADDKLDQLNTWANANTALTTGSVLKRLDSLSVLIEAPDERALKDEQQAQVEGYICQMEWTEL